MITKILKKKKKKKKRKKKKKKEKKNRKNHIYSSINEKPCREVAEINLKLLERREYVLRFAFRFFDEINFVIRKEI